MDDLLKKNKIDEVHARYFLKLYSDTEKQMPHLFWNAVRIGIELSHDSEFKELVNSMADKTSDEYRKIEFAKNLCNNMNIPALSSIEKTVCSTKTTNEIIEYLIDRTSKIGGFDNAVKSLEVFKNEGISLSYMDEIEEFYDDFINYMMATDFINNLKEIKLNFKPIKLPVEVPTSVTKVKDGKYVSIDMQASCFSVLFHYIVPMYGLKFDYESRESLAKIVSDKVWIYSCKRIATAGFNKLMKNIGLMREIEDTRQYIINKIACYLHQKGLKIVMVGGDEIIVENVNKIDLSIEDLRPELGEIIDKFNVEYFELTTVVDRTERYVVKRTEKNERKYLRDAEVAYRLYILNK